MKKYAVIVAGGMGTRMGLSIPKQFLLLHDKPIVQHTLEIFYEAFPDLNLILVVPGSYMQEGKAMVDSLDFSSQIELVAGGDSRFQSVKNGLSRIKESSIIFVHDAVRCLVTTDLIRRCYEQAKEKGSAIPAVEAKDSIRIVNENGSEVLDRKNIRIIQTPQTFRSDIILPAFRQDYKDSFTDEATVVEAFGEEVFLIQGEEKNIKITLPVDIMIAEKIAQGRINS